MPYTLAPNNQRVDPHTTFVGSDGLTYAPNWWGTSNEADRTAVGLTWINPANGHDQEFYWATGKPKELADAPIYDSYDAEGNGIGSATGTRVGLKSQWIQRQKDSAKTLLSGSDWYVTRKAEIDIAIPSKTVTYRAAVRTKCAEREATLQACTTTEELCMTIRGTLPKTVTGTADNGAAERFDTSKEKLDGSGNSFDPKQYESFDPKQYEDISNPALLEAWPEEE